MGEIHRKKKEPLFIAILSLFFSFFMVMGESFRRTNSWDLVLGTPVRLAASGLIFISFFLVFRFTLKKLYKYIDKGIKVDKPYESNKFLIVFNNHSFILSLIIILLCWLPYIIAFYPSILSPDPSNQIRQFFGIPNYYSEYVVLLDEGVVITNHHPVLHTFILGGMAKVGYLLGSINLGLFIYSILQVGTLSAVFAYTIYYMRELKLPIKLRIAFLLAYSLVPVFPLYAMSAVKDVIFGALIILYIIFLFTVVKAKEGEVMTHRRIGFYMLLIILITLFRNNGIHVILLTLPFAIYKSKAYRRQLGIIFLSTLLIYGGYSKLLLPALRITPGSIREALSIPFQQTARYVLKYEDELTEQEIRAIDKLLNIETLGERYKPEISDPVKGEFNKYAQKEELINYFKVWARGLIKHPGVYIEATMNNTYGYFYPGKTNWYVYYRFDDRLAHDGFDYHYNNLFGLRKSLSLFAVAFPYIPVIGLMVNIAFNVWLIFTGAGYLIYRRKLSELIFLSPALVLILICIASPVNAYFRYSLPYIFSMPLMISLFLYSAKMEG
ncbi:DUF6020 family protein [Alloiococcus sp. CFN-8]|uniref:DUF6020 family protein n=1 Tax=Alloiococcus sp. CFN-8 TaxID=3416081 RepID=UPI003CF84915